MVSLSNHSGQASGLSFDEATHDIISFIKFVALNGAICRSGPLACAGCFTPFSMTELIGEVITILSLHP